MLEFTEQELNHRCYSEYQQALEFFKIGMLYHFVVCVVRGKLYESLRIESGYHTEDLPPFVKDIEKLCSKELKNILVTKDDN